MEFLCSIITDLIAMGLGLIALFKIFRPSIDICSRIIMKNRKPQIRFFNKSKYFDLHDVHVSASIVRRDKKDCGEFDRKYVKDIKCNSFKTLLSVNKGKKRDDGHIVNITLHIGKETLRKYINKDEQFLEVSIDATHSLSNIKRTYIKYYGYDTFFTKEKLPLQDC